MSDLNKTQMLDPNRTQMISAPTLDVTATIKPVQCPVCKTFNPGGMMFCSDCGLIFERALDGDAFGAPSIQLPVLVSSEGVEFVVRVGETVFGRQGDALINDDRVSRQHCSISLQNGVIEVKDLGSTNGTKVDGARLVPNEPRQIVEGAKLSLGGFELTLAMPGAANATLMASTGKTVALTVAPQANNCSAKLTGDTGTFDLKFGSNSFGRKSGNDVVIADPFVSGSHGIIEVEDSGIYLTDTGSTNGTVVNDAKLNANIRTLIGPDDVIKLGQLEFKIERITPES